MSLSYNQVIKLNRDFSDAHFILKNFGNGEAYEIVEHNQTESFKYPLMFMEDLAMPFNNKVEVFSFRVFFVQRVAELEDRGEDLYSSAYNEAKSDMMQCAKDFISYWRQDVNYPEFNIESTGNRETFQEKTQDRLSGCYVDVVFRQANPNSACAIPMSGITPPASVVCEPVTVENSDESYQQSVASGGTLVLPDDTFNVYLNTVLQSSVTDPVLTNTTINITIS